MREIIESRKKAIHADFERFCIENNVPKEKSGHLMGVFMKQYELHEKGRANMNQIEGYWGYVKNGLRGSFKSISRRYLPFYLVEFEYKYNRRNKTEGLVQEFLKDCVCNPSAMLNYKPVKDTKEVVYG